MRVPNNLKVEELHPMKDTRESFYGKALVKRSNNRVELYSYYTLVCVIPQSKDWFLCKQVNPVYLYSQTTLRHIREFLYQELGLEFVSIEKLKARTR